MTKVTVSLAIVYVMTVKQGAGGSSAAIVVGVLAGCALAVPFWRPRTAEASPVPDSAG
jgi:hypothetical protein